MEGGELPESHPLPPHIADALRYRNFAKRFGWTPDEVDNQPATLVDWMLQIDILADEIEARRQQQEG